MKYKRWVAVFDNHGDQIDAAAERTFFEFLSFWKPEIRVHGGDCFDFRYLRKGASPDEQREEVKADYECAMDFLQRLQPTHFLRGNHDERLWDLLKCDDGKVRDYAQRVIQEILHGLGKGCQVLPYNKRSGVLELGKLQVVHGYSLGVNAARIAAQAYGSVIMGHTHTIDHQTVPGLDIRMGRTCGCLCKLEMDYNRSHIGALRQAHGWAYGILTDEGYYQLFQAQRIGGSWFFPSEVRALKG